MKEIETTVKIIKIQNSKKLIFWFSKWTWEIKRIPILSKINSTRALTEKKFELNKEFQSKAVIVDCSKTKSKLKTNVNKVSRKKLRLIIGNPKNLLEVNQTPMTNKHNAVVTKKTSGARKYIL